MSVTTMKISLCLFFTILTVKVKNENDFFILEKDHRFYCVSNSLNALTWINNDMKNTNSDIYKMLVDRNVWKESNRFSTELILDPRWNDLPTFKTTENNYLTVAVNLETEFIVPLSIRIERNAHIFLCKNEHYAGQNCYWIQMKCFKNQKTSVHKCFNVRMATITDIETDYKNHGCTVNINQRPFSYAKWYDLNKNKWYHFVLEKKGTNVTLSQIDERNSTVVTFSDSDASEFHRMIVYSGQVPGFWKVHTANYVYTKNEVENEKFLSFKVSNGFFCVSMFISMCQFCEMKIVVRDTKKMDKLKEINYKQLDRQWQQINITIEEITGIELLLTVSTIKTEKEKEGFWAISSIKTCSMHDLQIIESDQELDCQRISLQNDVLSVAQSYKAKCDCSKSWPWKQKFCNIYTSVRVQDQCSLLCKVCNNFRCTCFLKNVTSTEVFFKIRSVVTNYGVDIKEQKENNWRTVIEYNEGMVYHEHHVNNLKPNTTYNLRCRVNTFWGDACVNNDNQYKFETRLKSERVRNFNVTRKSPSQLLLNWSPPSTNRNDEIVYTLEYKQISFLACNSTITSKKRKVTTKNLNLLIEDLHPYSNYSFTIFANVSSLPSEAETIWETTSPTHTAIQTLNVVDYRLANNTLLVILSKINCTKIFGPLWIKALVQCTSDWCHEPNKSTVCKYNSRNPICELDNLAPYSNYTLRISYSQTRASNYTVFMERNFSIPVSHPVQNLLVYSKNASSLSLRWTDPIPPTGKLAAFRIQYVNGDSKNLTIEVKDSQCKIWQNYFCITLSNLKSNQIYTVEVSARNENVADFGTASSVKDSTTIEPPEPPYGLVATWNLNNDLKLEWMRPNKTNGELEYFLIEFNLQYSAPLSELVQVLGTKDEYNCSFEKMIPTEKLQPSSSYEVKVSTVTVGSRSPRINITTVSPPCVPLFEKEPKVFTENNSITIEIPSEITNRTNNNTYEFFLLKSQKNFTPHELEKYNKSFLVNLTDFQTVLICKLSLSKATNFTIGGTSEYENCSSKPTSPLKEKFYNITLVLVSTYQNQSRYKIYSYLAQVIFVKQPVVSTMALGAIVFFLTIIITISFIFLRLKKEQQGKIPETIPLTSFPNDTTYQIYSEPISVDLFETYVKKKFENENKKEIIAQQQKVLGSSNNNHDYETVEGNLSWDYIDLNFSDGNKIEKAYIVTERITSKKFQQFWKTVFDENVKHIVLIENADDTQRQKIWSRCWPEKNRMVKFERVTIKMIFCKIFADYEHRKFLLTSGRQKREIEQYRFLSWPENDIPSSTLILQPFFKKTVNLPLDPRSPILVLSPKMEVTGFFLLSDICLRNAKKCNIVDIVRSTQLLAKSNTKLVGNIKYYLVAHLLILENILESQRSAITEVCWQQTKNMIWLDKQMKKIQKESWDDLNLNSNKKQVVAVPENQENIDDHQYTYIDSLDLITVDGYQSPKKFLVVMKPTKHSLSYFWKMVSEKNVKFIVSLNSSPEMQEFWPTKSSKINLEESLILTHKSTSDFQHYIRTIVDLQGKNVEIFLVKNWSSKNPCPNGLQSFLNFLVESNKISKDLHPIVVTCCDGKKACGLYLALSYINEQFKMEGTSDVSFAVRRLKCYHQEFLKDIVTEQFTFLWRVLRIFLREQNACNSF